MIIQKRKLFLRNFCVLASIGIHDFEQNHKQRILINIDLYLSDKPQLDDDRIEGVLDYDFLRNEISRLVSERHFNLQETLCHEIIKICMSRDGISRARISTEKPDIYPDCKSVGYEADIIIE